MSLGKLQEPTLPSLGGNYPSIHWLHPTYVLFSSFFRVNFLFLGIAQLCRLKLYSPENGKIDELKETKSGEFSATFECNPGYRMIGQKRIACINGHWVSRVPWCKCKFTLHFSALYEWN